MFEAATEALASLADPSMLLFLGAGIIVGLVIGVIPGLGGTGAVAVLLPFVFVLEPNQAIAMIIGCVAVVHTSDAITSIVLGIPGSAAASVFLLDGHKMAKKGEGGRALSASFIASTIGGLAGVAALTVIIPIARPVVTAFGSPEIFMLIILGIVLTAVLSQGNMIKGLLISVFGVVLGLVGMSPISAEYRWTFGSEYLTGGIGLVAAALGIFGVAEIIHLVAKKTSIASDSADLKGGYMQGFRDIRTYKADVVRGSAVGVGVGILPGVGSTAGAWLAYGQAQAVGNRRKRKRPGPEFGEGNPAGVISPSAASTGIESGALIPTLLFGVPGAAPFALLLGVLLIFGIQPGPELIEQDLDLVYFIVWSFAFAAVIGSVLAFFMARPLSRLSFVSFPVLAAALIPILYMSGFQEPLDLNVFYTMLILGIIGWVCKITDIPRAPFLIAYVLAIPLERYYFITVSAYDPVEWMTRPFVFLVMAGAFVIGGIMLFRRLRARERARVFEAPGGASVEGESTSQPSSEKLWQVPTFVHLGVSLGGLIFFTIGLIMSFEFSESGQVFPLVACLVGIGLSVMGLMQDLVNVKARGFGRLKGAFRTEVKIVGISTLWIIGFIWVVFAVGMYVGTAIFTLVFLLVVARKKIVFSTIYTGLVVAALYALETYAELVAPVGWLL